MAMKHAIEFRDARVQALAEALFTQKELRFLMVSKAMPVAPQNEEQRVATEAILAEAEADIMRARKLLTLTDMAVALNGDSFDRILKYADNAEDNPEGTR